MQVGEPSLEQQVKHWNQDGEPILEHQVKHWMQVGEPSLEHQFNILSPIPGDPSQIWFLFRMAMTLLQDGKPSLMKGRSSFSEWNSRSDFDCIILKFDAFFVMKKSQKYFVKIWRIFSWTFPGQTGILSCWFMAFGMAFFSWTKSVYLLHFSFSDFDIIRHFSSIDGGFNAALVFVAFILKGLFKAFSHDWLYFSEHFIETRGKSHHKSKLIICCCCSSNCSDATE